MKNIDTSHRFLKKRLEEDQKQLRYLHELSLLSPNSLNFGRLLALKIERLTTLLNLNEKELSRYRPNEPSPSEGDLVALILRDPPISQVLFKKKGIDDLFHVSLLTACNVMVESVGNLGVRYQQTIPLKKTKKRKAPRSTASESEEVVIESEKTLSTEYVVRTIKINSSTRMSIVPLAFSLSLSIRVGTKGKKVDLVALTRTHFPLIAITNESQWMDAELKLLLRDVYPNLDDGATGSVNWYFFANCLHRRFLKATATKQIEENSRPFSITDWRYFHEKFFDSNSFVTSEKIVAFWKWFGPIMQTLRFKKHISALWYSGLLFGFVSKEVCCYELEGQRDGTFIVRFSEKFPGLFAVAFVFEDGSPDRVKHYLVKPEDTGSQKSLPDFLREKTQFKYLLRYEYKDNQLSLIQKETALKPFYSKSRITSNSGDIGYQHQVY
jgi:hypothetical protein